MWKLLFDDSWPWILILTRTIGSIARVKAKLHSEVLMVLEVWRPLFPTALFSGVCQQRRMWKEVQKSGGDLLLIITGLELVHLSLPPSVPATTGNLVWYRYLFEMLPICPDTARYQASSVIQGSLSVAAGVDSVNLLRAAASLSQAACFQRNHEWYFTIFKVSKSFFKKTHPMSCKFF